MTFVLWWIFWSPCESLCLWINIYFSKHRKKQWFESREIKKFDFNQKISEENKQRQSEKERDERVREKEGEREKKRKRVCVGLHIIITGVHAQVPPYLRHRRHHHNINLSYWSCSGQNQDQHPSSRASRECFWCYCYWLISLGDKCLGSLDDTPQLVGLFLSMTVIFLLILQTLPLPGPIPPSIKV